MTRDQLVAELQKLDVSNDTNVYVRFGGKYGEVLSVTVDPGFLCTMAVIMAEPEQPA